MSSLNTTLRNGADLGKLTDDELLELVWSYEGYYQCKGFDEDTYSTWFEDAQKLNEEALKRDLGCHFEIFQDCCDEDFCPDDLLDDFYN